MSRRLAFVAVAVVFIVLFGGRWVALRYTEHLWYADLLQADRFRWLMLRSLGWQAATFLVAFAWHGANTLGVHASIGSVHLPRRLGNLDIDEAVPARTLRSIALGVAALLAAVTTYTFSDLDDYVALARHAAPYGLTDPVLHHDAAFYLAVLPLFEYLHLFAAVAVLLATVLVIALYALTGSFAVSRRRVRITPHARTHLVLLLCALALIVAAGFQLDAFQLVAGGGSAGGALSPVDYSVRIPASRALAAIGIVAVIGSAMALRWLRPPLLFALWSTLGVAAVLGRFLLPAMTSAWGSAGDPGLVRSVRQFGDGYSRLAFGLTDLPGRSIGAGPLNPDSAAALVRAADGLYVWSRDGGAVGRMLDRQLADTTGLRVWTLSPAVATSAAGRPIPVAIAVPQTDVVAALHVVPRPRWTPLHRGALAWGDDPVVLAAGPRPGRLRFLSSLAPADSAPPGTVLDEGTGRVRFLPRPAELAVIGPDENRVGEPAPGVLLRGVLRRLLLAWALQAPPLLDDHTSNADRLLYWRDVPTRLGRLYPFAAFDQATAVLLGGRLTWVANGYLVSAHFPLAQTVRWRGDDVNYVASPYLVTVDADNGRTRFYLRPAANAFAASVARAADVAPLPADSIPPQLLRELHYPSQLLGAQAAMLARLGDERAASPWSLSWADTSAAGHDVASLPSTLALAALRGTTPRYWQMVPISDARGDHLVAVLGGAIAADGELELVLLRVRGADTPTPVAASGRIGAAPALLAAAVGTGGGPRRGPVEVLPAAGTVAYIQILYDPADGDAHAPPEGVGIYVGDRVGLAGDVPGAVRALLQGEAAGATNALTGSQLAEARAAFQELDSARAAGDWERFGRAWVNLRRALRLEAGPQQRRP